MRKALAIVSLTLFLSLPVLGLPAVLRPATAHALTPTTAEKRIIAAINRVRVRRDLPRIHYRSSLMSAARSHARELAARQLLCHASLNGWTTGQRVRHFGYSTADCTYWTAGEDLARAKAGTTHATARRIVRRWMGSPAHRAVLLSAKMRDVGVGISVGADGMKYVTVDLGRRIR